MLWITLTETTGNKIEVNLSQAVTMQALGDDETIITFAFVGPHDRLHTVFVKEAPAEIYELASESPRA